MLRTLLITLLIAAPAALTPAQAAAGGTLSCARVFTPPQSGPYAHADLADDRYFSAFVSLPQYHQTTDYTCGPSVAHAVLEGLGLESVSEMTLAKVMGTTAQLGSEPGRLVSAVEFYGAPAHARVMTLADVAAALRKKHPVIALVQLGQTSHWVAITGMSKKWIRLMDPWYSKHPIVQSQQAFQRRWWGEVERRYVNLGIEVSLP